MPTDIIKKNIILLGDGAVGKTSLIRRFVIDEFSDDYITTIGSKVTKKEVELGSEDDRTNMILMIWDIIGQKGYRYTQSLSFRGMNGALLIADLTRKDTLDSLQGYWIPLLIRIAGPVPMIFLGNKADLKDEVQFGLDEIQVAAAACEAFGSTMESHLTSAKTGENVEEVFHHIAEFTKKVKTKPKLSFSWNLMERDEIGSLKDIVDHIIADFSDQFGGIEHATPIIKHQIERSQLDLVNPSEVAIVKFVDNLANIESSFKSTEVVEKNRMNRLSLFGHK